METHAEHSKRAKNAAPCTAHDITFGGRCLACGYDPDKPTPCDMCDGTGKIGGIECRRCLGTKVLP